MMGEATGARAVYTPAYGPVRRAVEYGLFYVVVDRCTRLLVALFSETPMFASYVPTLETASAAALWGMLALVVALEVRRQYEANPLDAADLAELRPSPRRLAFAGGAAAIGAGTVAVAWPTVARLTDDVALAVTVGEEVLAHATSAAGPVAKGMGILGTDLGVLIAFSAGFVLFTYGFDRLIVGLVREAQYRRHARSA